MLCHTRYAIQYGQQLKGTPEWNDEWTRSLRSAQSGAANGNEKSTRSLPGQGGELTPAPLSYFIDPYEGTPHNESLQSGKTLILRPNPPPAPRYR